MAVPSLPAEQLSQEFYRQWSDTPFGAVKHPDDLERYRRIIAATDPDVLIETGTAHGGSAKFFASLGIEVITVDVAASGHEPVDGITWLTGNSTDPEIVETIRGLVDGRRVMVCLDSAHDIGHVTNELDCYADMVSSGCYCVVEDGIVSFYNPGREESSPRDAALAWFAGRDGWAHDDDLEALTPTTMHPDGWWFRA
ncbi:hypothetical protein EBS40_07505 [bacterium]|nr:hypothetical protein [bacterium]NDG19206.1 hypothetical protein [Betaproteobacteria bacterium]